MWDLLDWMILVNALKAMLAGVNPYSIGERYHRLANPIWVLALVAPSLLFPTYESMWWAVEIAIVASVIVTANALHPRRPVQWGLALASAGVVGLITYGNSDSFVWLGLLMPMPVGLFFLTIKPQVTFLVIAVLALRRLDRAGLPAVVAAFLPVGIATVIWLLVFGLPNYWFEHMLHSGPDASLWPYGLIAGVPIALWALYKRSVRLAMLAGPLCAPYLTINSYVAFSYAYPLLGFVLGWWKVIEHGATANY